MKKSLLFIFIMLLNLQLWSQDSKQGQVPEGETFFIGLSYSYLSFDLKLSEMSIHSVWQGTDMGTHDLSAEDLDDISSFAERTATTNAICLEAGMPLLRQTDSKWSIDGLLMVGMAQTEKTIFNKNSGKEEYSYNSGLSKPYFGLGFNVVYAFNPTWGLALRPMFSTSMGTNKQATENQDLIPENFTQNVEDTYITFYERISVLGRFTIGNFKLFAGPGFYWITANHEYIVEQTNISNGDVLRDEIITKGIPRSFVDGNLGVEWKAMSPLTIFAHAGIGKDVYVNSGIHFSF